MDVPRRQRALVREIAKNYAEFYRGRGKQVSRELAETQHAAYIGALEAAGLLVRAVDADDRYYDCVFVEDTAVVWADRALITRMAPDREGPDREGEQAAVEAALKGSFEIVRLPAGALLEGGDVLHTDDNTYVGLSARTNEGGADAVKKLLASSQRSVVAVPVRTCLHLKTAITYLGDGTLLTAPGLIDLSYFTENIIETSVSEPGAANCVRVNDRLLIATGYPSTESRVRAFAKQHGVEASVVPVSQFEAGDGSLTCLSIIW